MKLALNPVLGLVLGANPKWLSIWKLVINNIRIRLGLWKGCLLSIVGRVCLIKTVFSSLPLYYMKFFLMVKRVACVITSIKRRFLWCGDSKDETIYKVAWKKVVKGNNRRGLGISSLEDKYNALLLKWLWRLRDNNSGGWQELINKKYQVSFTNSLPILHPPLSATWQSINSLIDTNSAIRDILKNNCWYRVDNDKHIHAYFPCP